MSSASPDTKSSVSPSAASGRAPWQQAARHALRSENRRVLGLVVVAGLFMLLTHFSPLRVWITNMQVWKHSVDEWGWMADLAFAGACALGVMLGLPRLPLCAGAGLVFGFAEGTLLSLTGTLIGSYGVFLSARVGLRQAAQTQAQRWPWLNSMLDLPSLGRVFWVRQLMLPGVMINVMLGMTAVTHPTFLLGTLLGYLPLNIAFALVGSGLGKNDLAQSLTQLLSAIAVTHLAAWLLWRTIKRKDRR
jgi:uncharacterized membrane protein YdjX (TVP38/TMEM64 family)